MLLLRSSWTKCVRCLTFGFRSKKTLYLKRSSSLSSCWTSCSIKERDESNHLSITATFSSKSKLTILRILQEQSFRTLNCWWLCPPVTEAGTVWLTRQAAGLVGTGLKYTTTVLKTNKWWCVLSQLIKQITAHRFWVPVKKWFWRKRWFKSSLQQDLPALPGPILSKSMSQRSSWSCSFSFFLFFFEGSSGGLSRDSSSDLLISEKGTSQGNKGKVAIKWIDWISITWTERRAKCKAAARGCNKKKPTHWVFDKSLSPLWRPHWSSWQLSWWFSCWAIAAIKAYAEECSADGHPPAGGEINVSL